MDDMMQMTRPQMMPNAPSVFAADTFGGDARQHQQMIQQALALAQMRAKMDAQKADEFGAAAPGRMAEIGLGNMKAQGALADGQTAVDTQTQETKNKFDKSKIEEIQNELKKMEPWANAWDLTKSEEEKNNLHHLMAERGVTFGTKDVSKMTMPEVDAMMKNIRAAQANSPTNFIKLDANNAKRDVATTRASAQITSTMLRDQTLLKLKAMGINSEEQRQKTEESLWRAMKAGTLDEQGAETLKTILLHKELATQARGDLAKPEITIKDGKIETNKPAINPLPDIQPSKPRASTGPQFDLQKGTVSVGGKKLTISQTAKDSFGNVIKVKTSDGQVFNVK
jgi:hypothetical protein